MTLVNSILRHIDWLNCCIIWVLLIILDNMRYSTFYDFMTIYAWIGWIPFIFGLRRFRNFGKNTIDTALFLLNVITIPVFCFLLLGIILIP